MSAACFAMGGIKSHGGKPPCEEGGSPRSRDWKKPAPVGSWGSPGGPGSPRGPRALGAPRAPIGRLRCGAAPPVQGAAPCTKDWQRQSEKTQPIAPKTGRGRANRPRPQRQRSREAAPISKDRERQGHRCSAPVHQRLAEAGYGVGRLTFL